MARVRTFTLQPETKVTLIADEFATGRYMLLEGQGSTSPISIGPSQTITLGPFNETRKYRIVSETGEITYTFEFDGLEGASEETVLNILSNATLELVTPQNTDQVLIKDSSDNGKLKAVTIQSLIDLIGESGGDTTAVRNTVTKASHGFNVGDVIALSSSGVYIKAISSDDATCEVVGVVSSVEDTSTFTIITQGYISTLAGLTPGAVYFVSDTVPGLLSTSVPFLPDTVIKPVLIAESSSAGYIQNYLGVNND